MTPMPHLPLAQRVAARLRAALTGAVRTDEPLAPHTTWRAGGPADLWIEPANEAELTTALRILEELGVPFAVLGRGSNVLVADAGARGAVLSLEAGFSWIGEEPDPTGRGILLACGGGTPIAALLRHAAARELVGVEMLTGIPGTVGGAVRMNAGTHLGEVANALVDVRIANAHGDVRTAAAAELDLTYRHSALAPTDIVVSARFLVTCDPAANIGQVIRDVKERRRATQPLTQPSGGSTFANPPGDKAWRLIDAAGLRGVVCGGAQISPVHPNFIVNTGHATAADIATLIHMARREVHRQFGVTLRPEVCWFGDWPMEDNG